VEKNIKSSGFENVNVILLYDLELDAKDLDNTVDLVKINDTQTFTTTSHFPYDSPVEIVVHTVKTIPVSLSYKEAMGMDHKELVKSLKKAGFVNIKEEAIKDIVTGWITKDGQIESVTIDEKDDFGKEDKFRPDASILIQYHTWKN
ncbi:MAG: hypothetical protein KBT48_00340, partial [Firmicutes bacterium]|nr:hypothetical protein [Bacillota bacterium]